MRWWMKQPLGGSALTEIASGENVFGGCWAELRGAVLANRERCEYILHERIGRRRSASRRASAQFRGGSVVRSLAGDTYASIFARSRPRRRNGRRHFPADTRFTKINGWKSKLQNTRNIKMKFHLRKEIKIQNLHF